MDTVALQYLYWDALQRDNGAAVVFWARHGGVILAPALLALRPVSFQVLGDRSGSVAAVVTPDSLLYFFPSYTNCLRCPDPCYSELFGNGHRAALPKACTRSMEPWGLYSFDESDLRVVLVPDSMQVELVILPAGADRWRWDSILVPAWTHLIELAPTKAGQRILSVSLSRADSAVWITGTSGLLRKLTVGGYTIVSDTVLDSAFTSAEDILCFADGYAGTASGSIYSRRGSTFEAVALGLGHAVRSVDMTGACGDGGLVVVNANARWDKYTIGAGNYRRCNLLPHWDGNSVELLDENWHYSFVTYRDTQTTFRAVLPGDLTALLAGQCRYYSGAAAETLQILSDDADQNNVFLGAAVQRRTGRAVLNRVNCPGAFAVTNAEVHPRVPPPIGGYFGGGGLRVADDTCSIVLTADSVVLGISTLDMMPVMCTWFGFGRWCTCAADWTPGDTLVLWFATDSVRVVYDTAAGVHTVEPRGRLSRTVPSHTQALPLTHNVFNLLGRRAILSGKESSGLYLVQDPHRLCRRHVHGAPR